MNPGSTGYWFAVQNILNIFRLVIGPRHTEQNKIGISGSLAPF
jgi:hypothetical protein